MRYPASETAGDHPPGRAVPPGASGPLWTSWAFRRPPFIAGPVAFCAFGDAGLEDRNSSPGRVWNRIPDDVRGQIIDLVLAQLAAAAQGTGRQVYGHQGLLCLGSLGLPASQGPRPDHSAPLSWSSRQPMSSAPGPRRTRTRCGRPTSPISRSSAGARFYLSTILDDYSRYIIAWKALHQHDGGRCDGNTEVGARSLQDATAPMPSTGRSCSATTARPISPAIWLNGSRTTVWITFGAHRITRKPGCKIERWHQNAEERIMLENYCLPGDLENQISAFVDHYNCQRYHESHRRRRGRPNPTYGRHIGIMRTEKKGQKTDHPSTAA